MKVQLTQPLDPKAVIPSLSAMLPGYTFSMRGSKILVARKTAAVGATVFFRKDKLVVNGNFPSMGLQVVFMLAVLSLGILIPLLVYFLTVYRSQRASEQEVGAALQAMLGGAAMPQAQGYVQQGYAPPYPGQPHPGQPYPQGYPAQGYGG